MDNGKNCGQLHASERNVKEHTCFAPDCIESPSKRRAHDGSYFFACDKHVKPENGFFYCVHRNPAKDHYEPIEEARSFMGRLVCYDEYVALVRFGVRYYVSGDTKADIVVDRILLFIARTWSRVHNHWKEARRMWRMG
jgi:hypothetical protein